MTFLTIGQTPRNDLVPELVEIIGTPLKVNEIGLLDEIVNLDSVRPVSESDVLVSRLRGGEEVELSESWVRRRLVEFVVTEPTVLLCTSEFGINKYIEPYSIIRSFLNSRSPFESLAVVVPERKQEGLALRWKGLSKRFEVFSFSPYEGTFSIPRGLRYFDYVYLDCMGYNAYHEVKIQEIASGRVISARRILGEFLRTIV